MSSYISQIQTKLKQAGLYTGDIDGIAGKLTVRAVDQALAKGICTAEEQKDVAVINATDPTVDGNQILTDAPQAKGNYTLSKTSLDKLAGVNPNLVKVVKRAIELTDVDFRVTEGLRTKERQAQLVKQGKSKTMHSRHLTGHAVDVVALVDNKVSWDFNHYYSIAQAFAKASSELGVKVCWGGSWSVITNRAGTPQSWTQAYLDEKKAKKQKPFLDGVHFELPA